MRKSVSEIQQKKLNREKITVVTAYDYTTSKLCDSCGIDIILVGDSAAMVMLGYPNTVSATMDEMIVFCKGVVNGSHNSMIVADMPFGSYQVDLVNAVNSAIKFIKLGCQAVKIEGGLEVIPIIKKFTEIGIPVMAHIGLKPQTSVLWEGYKVQGKTSDSSVELLKQALELEKAGAFSIVLELVSREIAEEISKSLYIPTIGIGSGKYCDGQVLVFHDLVGLYNDIKPRFVKRYMEAFSLFSESIKNYMEEVRAGKFPLDEHSYSIQEEHFVRFKKFSDTLKNITKKNTSKSNLDGSVMEDT